MSGAIPPALIVLREAEDRRAVAALREAGVHVGSVYDLVNTSRPYPEAIPTLIRLLSEIDEDRIKEGVARALTVKEARGLAAPPLLREFEAIPPDASQSRQHLKSAIGNALTVVATRDVLEEIVRMAANPAHGWPRDSLLDILGKRQMRDARSPAILLAALDDPWPGVVVAAAASLAKLGIRDARPRISRLLDHSDSLIRRKAKAALARLDKTKEL